MLSLYDTYIFLRLIKMKLFLMGEEVLSLVCIPFVPSNVASLVRLVL